MWSGQWCDRMLVCCSLFLDSTGDAVPLRLTRCCYNYSKSDRFENHYLLGRVKICYGSVRSRNQEKTVIHRLRGHWCPKQLLVEDGDILCLHKADTLGIGWCRLSALVIISYIFSPLWRYLTTNKRLPNVEWTRNCCSFSKDKIHPSLSLPY